MLRKLIALGLCSLALVVTFFIAYARRPATSLSSGHEKALIGSEPSSQNQLEAELLVLNAEGFQPKEIKRPRGKFLLAIQNQSTEEQPSFILTRETGQSLKQIGVPKRQSKHRELVDLPPGRYVLAETSHPEWTCRVTIEQ
jgi:hypothetical protein